MRHAVLSTGAALAAALALTPAEAAGPELKTTREFWTADDLEKDFLDAFGQDDKDCYGDFALETGPKAPDGPETALKRWRRAIVAIDASGSMRGKAAGRRKMEIAKEAVSEFLAKIPGDAEVGLVAFGHTGDNDEAGKPKSCSGAELIAEPGRMSAGEIDGAMRRFEATGWTPLASAITLAGRSFKPSETPGEQVVFVVSDGVETCGGDPVAAARALRQSDVKAVVNIIGFDVKSGERAALEAVAEAGGGGFSAAGSAAELSEQLRVAARNAREATSFAAASNRVLATNAGRATRVALMAKACVQRKTTQEFATFTRLGIDMERSGKTDAEAIRDVDARLKTRHQERLDAADAFQKKVQAELDAVQKPLEAERDRVRDQYAK